MKKSLLCLAAAMFLSMVSVPPAMADGGPDGNPEGPPPRILTHPTGPAMDGNPEGPPPVVVHGPTT